MHNSENSDKPETGSLLVGNCRSQTGNTEFHETGVSDSSNMIQENEELLKIQRGLQQKIKKLEEENHLLREKQACVKSKPSELKLTETELHTKVEKHVYALIRKRT